MEAILARFFQMGKHFSAPIPLEDSIGYFDLKIGKSTYYDLMADLKTKIKSKRKWLDLNMETR